MRIHPDGWKFIGIFAGVTLLFFILTQPLGWIGVILTLWCTYFFRMPSRVTPVQKGIIVSPADGKIVLIKDVVPPEDFDIGSEPRTRISIFLNVFDVHVNRIPAEGVIRKIIYHGGKFFNASLDKASEHNERNTLVIDLGQERDLAVVQIAGLIARRIRCDASKDERVDVGSCYGLIRFGSRVDVYLPKGETPIVLEGQYMIGGETVLCNPNSLITKEIFH